MNFDALLQEYDQVCQLIDGPATAVHLLGIGGMGMAGLALLLRAQGFDVSGCDSDVNGLTEALVKGGFKVIHGHDAKHLVPAIDCAIRSAAVPADHPEIVAARAARIPVFRRGTVLPALLRGRHAIAVAGTHGKTTTAAWIAQILRAAGHPVGFCIGGEIPSLGGVAADPGDDAWMVAEADESDGTLAVYEPETAVVTNIDFDHTENFADHAAFEDCFRRCMQRTRQRLIYGRDDAVAARLAANHPNAVSFGFDERSDYHGRILAQGLGWLRLALSLRGRPSGEVRLPAPGAHNALNALAAMAATAENGIAIDVILQALAGVDRPRRRYETLSTSGGRRIVSDYAHHPTEVRALIRTAVSERPQRILTVFQPHRYSRTLALGNDFPAAFDGTDALVLLPVYAASEAPAVGGTTVALYRRFREQFPRLSVWLARDLQQVEAWLPAHSNSGDLILIAGAGNVEQVGIHLAERWRREPPDGQSAEWRRELLSRTGLNPARVSASSSLAARTTLKVGGVADILVRITSELELAKVVSWSMAAALPLRVLGGGSNLLVSDLGVRGVVIRLEGPYFQRLSMEPDGLIVAGAAAPLARLAALSANGTAAGFGFLAGVPGTVGGAVRMNAGAWEASLGDRIVRIAGVDFSGRPWTRERDDLEFGYREGPVCVRQAVVTTVWLQPGGRDAAERLRIREYRRRRAWMRGRATAGSVFRNPDGVTAGALLDAAGCKGISVGGARVCREHANVIGCGPSACASDVVALMEQMRERVIRHSGTLLEPEIVVWS